jgi:hypothetical protein
MTKFFHFHQNNSGGFFEVNDTVDEGGCVFEAKNAKDANAKAEKAGVFSFWSCECCGARFSEQWDSEEGHATVEEAVSQAFGRPVVVHFKNGKKQKVQQPEGA